MGKPATVTPGGPLTANEEEATGVSPIAPEVGDLSAEEEENLPCWGSFRCHGAVS